jgi:hypothetical protein
MLQAHIQRESFYENGRNDCGARYGGIRMDPNERQHRILQYARCPNCVCARTFVEATVMKSSCNKLFNIFN